MDRANEAVIQLRAELAGATDATWIAVATRLVPALGHAMDYDGARALTDQLVERTRHDREQTIAMHLALAGELLEGVPEVDGGHPPGCRALEATRSRCHFPDAWARARPEAGSWSRSAGGTTRSWLRPSTRSPRGPRTIARSRSPRAWGAGRGAVPATSTPSRACEQLRAVLDIRARRRHAGTLDRARDPATSRRWSTMALATAPTR